MEILVELVKIGAIGASLAFLYLSYQLLKTETELKGSDGNPVSARLGMLVSIALFTFSSLAFLVVGVLSELVLANGATVISTIVQRVLLNDLVRVRFNAWEFVPEGSKVAFSFEENHIDTNRYILPALKDRYDVFVGVRKQDSTPYDSGQYSLMFGPFHIATLSPVEKRLSPQESLLLGNDCVEFTAFGIDHDTNTQVAAPFTPGRPPQVVVFNTASACIPGKSAP